MEKFKKLTLPYTYSYMVYQDGNKYYARNGSTGVVEYESVDATSTIQYTIDKVCTTGGRILIKSGNYPVSGIVIQGCTDVEIVGEGWSTKLIANGPDVTVIRIGDRTDATKASRRIRIANLYIDGSMQETETVQPENVSDRRFGISVNGSNTSEIVIENCYIYNTGSDSIYGYMSGHTLVRNNIIVNTRGYWAAIHVHGEHKFYVIGNTIINSAVGGIRHGRIIAHNYIENTGAVNRPVIDGGDYAAAIVSNYIVYARWKGITTSTHLQYRNIIANNIIYVATSDGIHVYGGPDVLQGIETLVIGNEIIDANGSGIVVNGTHVIVKGNVISYPRQNGIVLDGTRYSLVVDNIIRNTSFGGNNTYDGIRLTNQARYNRIIGNIIRSHRENRPRYGIAELSVYEDYNYIVGNYIEGYVTGAILKQGPNTIVKFNVGYLTENSGTATIPAGSTSVAVNHGLACTPSKVFITPLSQPPGSIWVSDITGATFKVNVSSAPTTDLPIVWYAEC
jgi:hypothetical protein